MSELDEERHLQESTTQVWDLPERNQGGRQSESLGLGRVAIEEYRDLLLAELGPRSFADRETLPQVSYGTADTATPPMRAVGETTLVYSIGLFQRRSLHSQSWRGALDRLRYWKGDSVEGEAELVSVPNLTMISRLAFVTEALGQARGIVVEPYFVPTPEGGVQAEWTYRGATWVHHFEAAALPSRFDRYELLATTETTAGEISRVEREIYDATLTEVAAAFEEFLSRIRFD